MPQVEEIELPAGAELGVAIEGSENWWPKETSEAVLPEINPYDDRQRTIEVFRRGQQPIGFNVESGAPWLDAKACFSKLDDAVSESPVLVGANWVEAPTGRHRVPITITGSDGSKVVVTAVVNNPASPQPEDVKGHVEGNGYVSIEAEHFTRAVDAPPIKWQVIANLGRTLSGVTASPTTAKQTPGGTSPHLEYKVHLFDAGEFTVAAYLSPTLNFAQSDGLRYAVSFDDEPPQIVNVHADTSDNTWRKWVADNINIQSTKHQITHPGEHVLKFWLVDPGLVLQKLVVSQGTVPTSYLGPPESFYRSEK
jgi:hypothetical protein